MSSVEDLKKELKKLQSKREEATEIKVLKKQIKAEKFAQTKSGTVFNAIADVGSAGLRVTKKFLSEQPQQTTKGKKKVARRLTVREVMARLPQ